MYKENNTLLAALGGSARIGTTYCHIATRPKYEIAPPVQQSHTEIPLQTCFKAGSYQLGEPFAAQDQGPTSVIPKLLTLFHAGSDTTYSTYDFKEGKGFCPIPFAHP